MLWPPRLVKGLWLCGCCVVVAVEKLSELRNESDKGLTATFNMDSYRTVATQKMRARVDSSSLSVI